MSITTVSGNVYSSIEDLEPITSISSGDRFLIQTSSGTALLDYDDLSIDLDHTDFKDTFQELVTFTTSVNTFVETIDNEFTTIKSDFEDIKTKFENMSYEIEAYKTILLLLMGQLNATSSDIESGSTTYEKIFQNYLNANVSSTAKSIIENFKPTSNTISYEGNYYDYSTYNIVGAVNS